MNYSDYYEEMRSYKTIERYIKDNSALVRGLTACSTIPPSAIRK